MDQVYNIFRSANPVIVWQLMESCCTSIMVLEVEEALHPPIMTRQPATPETNQTWWGQRRRFRLARVTLQVTLNGRVLIFANLDTKSIHRLFVPRIGAWAIQYQSRLILPQMSFEVALPNRGVVGSLLIILFVCYQPSPQMLLLLLFLARRWWPPYPPTRQFF